MRTILNLWETSIGKYGSNDFFLEKIDGVYKSFTYREINDCVLGFAAELISNGLEFGDRVSIIAMGSKDWVVSELGILFAGCISVPLSPKLDVSELKFRLQHSESKVVVIGANQYPHLVEMLNTVSSVQKIILLNTKESKRSNEVTVDDFISSGRKKIENIDLQNKLNVAKSKVTEDTLAILSYTSGTTAVPKGVMLSHKNMYVNTQQCLSLYPVVESDRMLLILPVDHSFAHTAGLYTFISAGAVLASVDQGKSSSDLLKNIPLNIKETKPTILLSVPALAKSFRKSIETGIKGKGEVVQKLFNRGLRLGYKYIGNGWNKGKGFRFIYYIPYKIYDKIIFSKVRENFGGQLKNFVGGGALLDVELQKFFMAIGMPMFQGYGLSESSPVISSNNFKFKKFGSSGRLVPFLELRILDDKGNELPVGEKGEICVKGDNVMLGYYKNEETTAQTIIDNWLHTGDMGYIDSDGFIYVLGRFKSLLISADGEKYSPEGIEDSLPATSPYIEQAMLYNEQNPYTIALIYPNYSAIKSYLTKNKIELDSEVAIQTSIELIQKSLTEYLSGGKYQDLFLTRWIPTTFAILSEGFTEQNTFLNSSLKMVRGRIVEHYKETIETLYTPEGRNNMSGWNYDIMKKALSK